MKTQFAALGVTCLFLSGCSNLASRVLPSNNQVLDPAKLRPSNYQGNYRLDKDHAAVLFEVNHLGFSGYIGRFNDVDARLTFDPAAPETATLDVVIASASVDTPSDVLDDRLRSSQMFDAAKYPVIRFQSRSITVTGDRTGTVTGDLTMNGVTKAVTLDVTFNGGAMNSFTGKYTLGFSGSGRLQRSAWGLSAWLPAVGDDVTLTLRAEFQKS